jgi:hypothetical protein
MGGVATVFRFRFCSGTVMMQSGLFLLLLSEVVVELTSERA